MAGAFHLIKITQYFHDVSGNIEGIHDQFESPAALLVDEAKSIRDPILDALESCSTSYRLFMSSTGQAFGGFYQICTAKSDLWRTFQIPSAMCPLAISTEPGGFLLDPKGFFQPASRSLKTLDELWDLAFVVLLRGTCIWRFSSGCVRDS